MPTLKKIKVLGKVPLAGLGKGMVYWLGKVRLGKFYLQLKVIK